jgi:uncharacterized membrane protein YhhN
MPSALILLTPLVALLDWFAVATQNKRLELFAKPAVMVLLLAWLWTATGFRGPTIFFAAGLLFSLAGDVFLMLPKERFIAGLISFLIAHLFYIIGFTRSLPPASLPVFIVAALVALTAWQIFRRVRAGLAASGKEKLILPVLVYTTVISVMLFTALLTLINDNWGAGTALLASAGGLLFFLSDGILAWNKFVEPLKNGRLAVIVTYHVGQMLIALAAAGQFG